jgi:hypothetical protein
MTSGYFRCGLQSGGKAAELLLARLRLDVEIQLLRSTVVEDMMRMFHFLDAAVGEHQMLTGSQVFLIFEEVLPGRRPSQEAP